MERQELYYLNQSWIFYPDVLLAPEEVPSYGGYWQYWDIKEKEGMKHGSGTYRLTLMLPEKPRTYALELMEIFSACRVFIDGKQVLQLGNPSPEHYTSEISCRVLSFEGAGETELLVAVSDWSGVYSGLSYPPAFGSVQGVLAAREGRLLLHGVVVLLAVLGALLSLAFGLWGKRRRGLLGVLLCICLVGVSGYPLLHGLCTTSFQPWYTLEAGWDYSLLLLGVVLQCELHGLQGRKVWLLVSPCILVVICALARFGGSAVWPPAAGAVFSGLTLGLKYYAVACLVGLSGWSLWKRRCRSVPLLCGSVALAGCLMWDRLLPRYQPVWGGWFTEVGGVLLTLSLGAVLWMDAVDAYRFRLTYQDNYRRMEERLGMQKEHYRQLAKQVQLSRETAHDLRHHMRTLRALAGQDQMGHLIDYLDHYEPHLAEREVSVWSEHAVADAVLSHYAAAAHQLGATYDVRLAIPPQISFPDDELCVLLGNLLENATEAMGRQQSGRRWLYLRGKLNQGRLVLLLDNTFDGIVSRQEESFSSRKHPESGLGLRSVQAIVKKYGGLVDFSVKEGIFHVSLMIPVGQSAQ